MVCPVAYARDMPVIANVCAYGKMKENGMLRQRFPIIRYMIPTAILARYMINGNNSQSISDNMGRIFDF